MSNTDDLISLATATINNVGNIASSVPSTYSFPVGMAIGTAAHYMAKPFSALTLGIGCLSLNALNLINVPYAISSGMIAGDVILSPLVSTTIKFAVTAPTLFIIAAGYLAYEVSEHHASLEPDPSHHKLQIVGTEAHYNDT